MDCRDDAAVKEHEFIALHEESWSALEKFLHMRERGRYQAWPDFPFAYRRLCEQLAYADNAGFSEALLVRLNRMALSGRAVLYRKRSNMSAVAQIFLYRLPQTVRREWRYFALAGALFCLPALTGVLIGLLMPEIAQQWAGEYAQMYEPSQDKRIGESRGAESDVLMFGYYLQNNTGIGLRTIAGGALLGIGVFVTLVYNGWFFGIISAHMITLGYAGKTFFPFVITHAAFELTAIVFSGACGLAIARGLFMPGRQTRTDAVRERLQTFFPVLAAVVVLFFIAAWVEAFWSALRMPPAVKFASGGICWALVIAYFALAGRNHATTGN